MQILFIFLGFGLVVGLIIYFSWRAEKKRREQLAEVAGQMGLEYHQDGDERLLTSLYNFKLFKTGRRHVLDNLVLGTTDEVQIAIFEFRYTTGSGKNKRTTRQSVASLQSSRLNAPSFTMRPQHMFDKLGSMIGLQDIDFDSHPNFSKLFVLKGEDEPGIRDFFTPSVLQFFEQRKGISVEAAPGKLIFYRPGRRVKPEEIKDLLGQAYEVFGIMVDLKSDKKA